RLGAHPRRARGGHDRRRERGADPRGGPPAPIRPVAGRGRAAAQLEEACAMSSVTPGGMSGHLVDFVEALRRQGLPVGPSKSVAAASAMVHIDFLDRAALREALASTILPKATHRGVFDQLFDLWFPAALGSPTPGGTATLAVEIPTDDDGKVDPEALNEL